MCFRDCLNFNILFTFHYSFFTGNYLLYSIHLVNNQFKMKNDEWRVNNEELIVFKELQISKWIFKQALKRIFCAKQGNMKTRKLNVGQSRRKYENKKGTCWSIPKEIWKQEGYMLVNPEGNMKTRGLNVGQSRRDDKILDVKMLIINQTPKGWNIKTIQEHFCKFTFRLQKKNINLIGMNDNVTPSGLYCSLTRLFL